jgi:hypothetical protein
MRVIQQISFFALPPKLRHRPLYAGDPFSFSEKVNWVVRTSRAMTSF